MLLCDTARLCCGNEMEDTIDIAYVGSYL